MADSIKFSEGKVLMVAHRGLSGLETENTLSAFTAAGQRSYYGIECDVHRTSDGKFVVIHDNDTKRVAGDSLIVEETSFDLLRRVVLKNRDPDLLIADCPKDRADLIIPTLKEYIAVCKKYNKKAVLELKNRFESSDIVKIVEEIKELGYLEGVIFISFSLENLIDLRAMLPEQPAQYLISKYDSEVRETLNKYHLDLDIRSTALTKEAIDEVHADGHVINCWTVDTAEEGKQLVQWGVDMITSNILE